MKNILSFTLMMLGLFATSVQAETKHCHTIEDCQKLKAEVEADLAELVKDATPELTGILQGGVSQYEAERICEDNGMRLPTARELALVAQSLGAEGISETKKEGYYLVRGSDSAGNPDLFYFSYKGYKRPAGDLGNKWVWSSSVDPDYSNLAFRLNGLNGEFDFYNRSADNYYNIFNAVRCVRSR